MKPNLTFLNIITFLLISCFNIYANTDCSGTATETIEGDNFTNGYQYDFSTAGTDVTLTFKLLDTRVGIVEPFLHNTTDGFLESQMTATGNDQEYSITLTGQTLGQALTFRCKFIYGALDGLQGFAVTKDLSYTVGQNCQEDNEAPTAFTATLGTISHSSVAFILNGTDNSGSVIYNISYNGTTATTASVSGVEKTFTINNLDAETNYTFEVTATDGGGNEATNAPISLQATTLTTPEFKAPDAPTRNADNVISVYSDTYTSIVSNINPAWGQATVVTEEDFDGNKILKYASLNYQGLEFPETDASTMTHVHIDYFVEDATAFKFSLISTGPLENPYDITQTETYATKQWVSLDIPLTEYPTPELDKVFQFKTEGNGIIYLDNIYFFNEAGSSLKKNKDVNTKVISSTGMMQISTTAPTAINIYSISGKIMFTGQCDNQINVNLERGIYIVKTETETLKSIVK